MNNILVWNCRGAGSPQTLYHIVDMIKTYKPSIVALLETRVPSRKLKPILDRSSLANFIAVEACGFADGIWLGWDDTVVTLELVSYNAQVLNVLTKAVQGRVWFLSIIYAAPHPLYRTDLWIYLKQLITLMSSPWLAVGDFNKVLQASEK